MHSVVFTADIDNIFPGTRDSLTRKIILARCLNWFGCQDDQNLYSTLLNNLQHKQSIFYSLNHKIYDDKYICSRTSYKFLEYVWKDLFTFDTKCNCRYYFYNIKYVFNANTTVPYKFYFIDSDVFVEGMRYTGVHNFVLGLCIDTPDKIQYICESINHYDYVINQMTLNFNCICVDYDICTDVMNLILMMFLRVHMAN